MVGREDEIKTFNEYEASDKAEFIAVYGRRRVGKTYLIRELYKDRFAFEMTGVINGRKEEQLFNFTQALHLYGADSSVRPRNWQEAFVCLQQLLGQKICSGQRCIVFLDELPCLDTPRAGFIRAFDHFWNGWAATRREVMLIVCGSATSWMVSNIINNRGGLHNRITHEIHLRPFNLHEVEAYLQHYHFAWNRLSIVQLYMILGGIPYYLSLLNPHESLSQNIDRLFFASDGELRREYERLYSSLFANPENYLRIIALLAESQEGLTREELRDKLKINTGGYLSQQLEDLVNCDFIRCYQVKEKRIKANAGIYQLTDFFTLFHTQYGKKRTTDEHYWSHLQNTPQVNAWMGLAFERVCMAHVSQIKQALGIDRIHTEYYSWRSKQSTPRAQIDLIIERADFMINLCEIKFSAMPYAISKSEDAKLRIRMSTFQQETATRHGIFLTFITPYGLLKNEYADSVMASLTMDDLFVG